MVFPKTEQTSSLATVPPHDDGHVSLRAGRPYAESADTVELHEDVDARIDLRLPSRMRDDIRAQAERMCQGRPRLRDGMSYTMRVALSLGLDVLRTTGAR